MVNANFVGSIILVITGLLGIWECLLLMAGKRIIRITSGLGFYLHLVISSYAINMLYDNPIYPELIIIAAVLIYLLISYYRGIAYKFEVEIEDDQLVAALIGDAIKEIEVSNFQEIKEADTSKYLLKDSIKAIELKRIESSFSKKKSYQIFFKRWVSLESKREILKFIDYGLPEKQETWRRTKLLLQLFFFIGIILLSLGISTRSLISDIRLSEAVPDTYPEKVYISATDTYYEDKVVIETLHQYLRDSYAFSFRYNDITNKEIADRTEISLHYNNDERIVYVGRNHIYAFSHDIELVKKYPLYKPLLWLYRIYDKEEGLYFNVFVEHTDWNGLRAIIDMITQ